MTPYRPRTAEARLLEDRAHEWLKSCLLAKGSSGLEDDERTSIGRALRRILGSCSDPVPTLIKFIAFLSAGSAQAPETPPLLARCLAAIETAITDEDGLDGVVGERLLREAGYWPPDPYAASSSDEQAEKEQP